MICSNLQKRRENNENSWNKRACSKVERSVHYCMYPSLLQHPWPTQANLFLHRFGMVNWHQIWRGTIKQSESEKHKITKFSLFKVVYFATYLQADQWSADSSDDRPLKVYVGWIPMKVGPTLLRGSRIHNSFSQSSFQIGNIYPVFKAICADMHFLSKSLGDLVSLLVRLQDCYYRM